MKKNNLKAKVEYNKEKDRFDVLISSDGGKTWGLDTGYYCVKDANGWSDEPEFIRYPILQKIGRCIDLGYEVSICGSLYASHRG